MKIEFTAAAASGPIVQLVTQGSMPASLPLALRSGAAANRFTGKAGQVHDGFLEQGGAAVRHVLLGTGDRDAADRLSQLERSGAALTARFLTSGETALTLDLTGAAACRRSKRRRCCWACGCGLAA